MPCVVTIARSFGVSPLPLRLHVECLRSGVVRVEMPASLCHLRSLAERRVLTIMDANLGVPFRMLDWQNSHQKRIGSALCPDSSLQDLSRAKRTSG
jgi:hypothetical protein